MSLDRDGVAKELQKRGVDKECHRCHNKTFSVIDGYAQYAVQDEFRTGMVLGGPRVPVALVACNNCGAITPHALVVLDILPRDDDPQTATSEGD